MKYLIIILSFLISHNSFCQDMDKLPAGYYWFESKVVETIVPVPDGWQVNEVDQDGLKFLHISQESEGQEQKITAELAVILWRGDTSEISPLDYAIYSVEIMKEDAYAEIIIDPWSKENPDGTTTIGIRYNYSYKEEETINIIYIVDENKKTLRTLRFSAPKNGWESAWKIGNIQTSKAKFMK